MKILAINTAFGQSYVGLYHGDKKILKSMDSSLKQSENILGLIDEVLSIANIDVASLDAVACVIGPGSFTGIRIGASLSKGFCSAFSNIKRISINSLDLLAYTHAKKNLHKDFWIVLNALSGNLFACKYDQMGQRKEQPMLAFGKEIELISGDIVGDIEERLEMCNNFESFSSDELLELAIKMYNEKQFSKDFEPVYLRKSQAEAELDKKLKVSC